MIDSNTLVTILTVGAVLINLVTAIRAALVAHAIDSAEKWVCHSVGCLYAKKILMGIATICLMRVVLKSWSIGDIFIDYWYSMPGMYHIRAFAYLGENYGGAMLGYAMITLIATQSKCPHASKLIDSKKQKQ